MKGEVISVIGKHYGSDWKRLKRPTTRERDSDELGKELFERRESGDRSPVRLNIERTEGLELKSRKEGR
jgi:hypothetical protein